MVLKSKGRVWNLAKITHISIRIGSGYNMLSKGDWLKLSKMDRLEKITGGSVLFLDEDGESIPSSEAVPMLKEGGWLD